MAQFSLGFMKPSEGFRFGHPGAFGAPGAGASMGYADPELRLGYGYVTNRMGTELSGDARDLALRAAIPSGLSRAQGTPYAPASASTYRATGTSAQRKG